MRGMADNSKEEIAEFFNGVTDAMGNHALHICAMYGSCKFYIFIPAISPDYSIDL